MRTGEAGFAGPGCPSLTSSSLLLILTGDFLSPSKLAVDEKEVEYKAAQDEQHTVEVLPGGITDDGGQNQKHGYESHQDGDENGHLQETANRGHALALGGGFISCSFFH